MGKFYKQAHLLEQGLLSVSKLHKIYYAISGNPAGKPIVSLHGGPGSKSRPGHKKFFNPEKYKIIQFDQRGCGKSKPLGEVRENTTWDLVSDMEKLRKHLGVKKWIVFGGSWGATLALAYAQKHPRFVKGLILRGVFLARDEDVQWLVYRGPQHIFPDLWVRYRKYFQDNSIDESNIIPILHQKIFKGSHKDKIKVCEFLENMSSNMLKLGQGISVLQEADITKESIAADQILMHYIIHKAWLKKDQLLRNVDKIRHIPTVIVHGRYDMTAPLNQGWALHEAFPQAEFYIAPKAGHHGSEPGIKEKLIEYTDKFLEL